MVKISHKQAQYLIRYCLDSPLTGDRWNTFQQHLESCVPCRAYQNRLRGVEKMLRIGLRNPARTPAETAPVDLGGLTQTVIRDYRLGARKRARLAAVARTVTACLAILLAMLFFATASIPKQPYFSGATEQARVMQAATNTIPSFTPLPTVMPGKFHAITLYESKAAGNADIFLLNPGSPPVNLTNSKSQDTDPIWSPDGEWIAFLSDRAAPPGAKGKVDLFMVSVAGTRLVQITNEHTISWQGPLTWSADGRWLALVGVTRSSPKEQYLYLVEVNAKPGRVPILRRLNNSRGAWMPKFAPYSDQLAYIMPARDTYKIVITHVGSAFAESADTTKQTGYQVDAQDFSFQFDWSEPEYGVLFYTTSPGQPGISRPEKSIPLTGEAISCARLIVIQNAGEPVAVAPYRSPNRFFLSGTNIPENARAVAWNKYGAFIYLVQMRQDQPAPSRLPPGVSFISHLCVTGSLDLRSWSPDGRWVVVGGHLPGEAEDSLYAVRMPELERKTSAGQGSLNGDAPVGALIHLSRESGAVSFAQVRPSRQSLGIDPQPARLSQYLEKGRGKK